MAYIDSYNAAHAPQFNQRVRVALLLEAQTIVTNPTPPANQTTLVGLIAKLMAAQDSYVQLFCDLLAANGLSDASTDAQIQTGVASAWAAFAGNI